MVYTLLVNEKFFLTEMLLSICYTNLYVNGFDFLSDSYPLVLIVP